MVSAASGGCGAVASRSAAMPPWRGAAVARRPSSAALRGPVAVVVGEAVEALAGVFDREPDVVGGRFAEALEQRRFVAVALVQDAQRVLGQLDELGFRERAEHQLQVHEASLPRGRSLLVSASPTRVGATLAGWARHGQPAIRPPAGS